MSTKTDAAKLVLEILAKGNRPYAVNDIAEKCGKEIGKSAVQKALDNLVDKDKVTMKTFGKTKIYFIKQPTNLLELKTELQNCTKKLTQAQNNVKHKQIQYSELEKKLKTLSKVRSMESLETERSKLLDDIRALNEKLRSKETETAEAKFTLADVKKIEKVYETAASAYRKRKRMCTDIVDTILEGYPKSKRALIKDLGLETDDAVGFNLKVKR